MFKTKYSDFNYSVNTHQTNGNNTRYLKLQNIGPIIQQKSRNNNYCIEGSKYDNNNKGYIKIYRQPLPFPKLNTVLQNGGWVLLDVVGIILKQFFWHYESLSNVTLPTNAKPLLNKNDHKFCVLTIQDNYGDSPNYGEKTNLQGILDIHINNSNNSGKYYLLQGSTNNDRIEKWIVNGIEYNTKTSIQGGGSTIEGPVCGKWYCHYIEFNNSFKDTLSHINFLGRINKSTKNTVINSGKNSNGLIDDIRIFKESLTDDELSFYI